MLNELLSRYPQLKTCEEDIVESVNMIINCYKNKGKLLLCGNGGSSADCEHIVGELMKGFLSKRPLSEEQKQEMKKNNPNLTYATLSKLQQGLPAIALPSMVGLNSAFCNDVDPELIYAQSLMGLGNKDDVVFCISTSGNSKNCVICANVAKGLGLSVVALTGQNGGKLKEIADISICVPETETYKVQELHLPIYHYICMMLERKIIQ